MNIVYCSSKGEDNLRCEDSVLASGKVSRGNSGVVNSEFPFSCALADGVSSTPGGQLASTMALTIFRNAFSQKQPKNLQEFRNLLTLANRELICFAVSRKDPQEFKMATTIAVAWINEHDIYFGYAGNTRIYIGDRFKITQLSHDHTAYQDHLDMGEKEPQCPRNIITACFGGGSTDWALRLVTTQIPKNDSDFLLMTTDGVHEYLSLEDIAHVMAKPDSDNEKIQNLCDLAKEHGSHDDLSCLLGRFN